MLSLTAERGTTVTPGNESPLISALTNIPTLNPELAFEMGIVAMADIILVFGSISDSDRTMKPFVFNSSPP